MLNKPNLPARFDHGIYNPSVLKKGQKLDRIRTEERNQQQQVLKTPVLQSPNGKSELFPFNWTWFGKQSSAAQQNIKNDQIKTELSLTKRYPWTYPLEQEKKFNVMRRFTTPDGQALSLYDQSKVLGKTFVTPEYWEFLHKNMEREDAMAFKAFCFNNMDISTEVKKSYWKKKCPELFEELLAAKELEFKKDFLTQMIELRGPETEKEFRWLYDNVFHPELYTPISDSELFEPPTTLPFPPIYNKDEKTGLGTGTIFQDMGTDGSTASSYGMSEANYNRFSVLARNERGQFTKQTNQDRVNANQISQNQNK